jgi:hypothetical protein
VKNTSIVLPPAIVLSALMIWRRRGVLSGARAQFNRLAMPALVTIVAIWPLTFFNFSAPRETGRIEGIDYSDGIDLPARVLVPALSARWPGGIYIGSLLEARTHAIDGHPAYLLGQHDRFGWWYYFMVCAAYKVPLGILVVLACAVLSLWRTPQRKVELFLVIPMLALALLIVLSGINIGFRHALPCYAFALVLAARCAADGSPGWMRCAAWSGAALAGLHALSYHPDYLSYFNGLSRKPYLVINDSNVDWGQAARQTSRWLDQNPRPGRVVYYDDFHEYSGAMVRRYLGDRVRHVPRRTPLPDGGILIISQVWVAGLYGREPETAHLRELQPIDVIGHCMNVYDLDARPPQRARARN